MAIKTAPSPNPTPASSAWSRLVQLTKNASTKTSHTNETESPKPSEHHGPSSAPAVSPKRRKIRLRRPIASPSRISTCEIRDQSVERDTTFGVSADEAESIEVCPCPVGDPPLSDGRCSLSKQCEHRPKLKSPSSGPTKTVTLSDLWGARSEERISTPKSPGNSVVNLNSPRNQEDVEQGNSEESRHRADDKTCTYAPPKAGAALEVSDQTNIPTAKLQNTSIFSSPSPNSSLAPSQISMAVSSKGSCFVARPTSSAVSNMAIFGHEASLDCQPSTAVTSGGSSTLIPPPQGPGAAVTTVQSTNIKDSTKELNEDEDKNLTTEPDTANLTTPSSSQESATSTPSSGNEDEPTNAPPTVEFKRKAKRRLTFHSAKYDPGGGGNSSDGQAPPKKKTKIQTKKKHTVQTTLSLAIGSSTGMRECKVCDTVYNPFHPEDVKVHAKRHAGVLKTRTANNA